MNLSPLGMITHERHPPLLWPLWDNVARTSTWTCLHTDTHTHSHRFIWYSLSVCYSKKALSVFHCPLLSSQLPTVFDLFLNIVSVIGLFMWFLCQWVPGTSVEIWPFYRNGLHTKIVPSPHTYTTAKGGMCAWRKCILAFIRTQSQEAVFLKPHFTLINSPKSQTAF